MRRTTISAMVLALTMGATAWAQCCSSKAKTAEKAGMAAQTVAQQGAACPVTGKTAGDCSGQCSGNTACMTPKMWYKVGGEKLMCPKNAEILAKANDTTIQYMVANQEFDSEAAALEAYGKALDETLAQVTTVQYAVGKECVSCPNTAAQMAQKAGCSVKYRVASWTFDNKDEAERVAKAAREAAEHVKMTATVDGKEYTCTKTAADAAKTCGKSCEYKVGESKTCCQTTAKVRLAEAKLDAALKAATNLQVGA